MNRKPNNHYQFIRSLQDKLKYFEVEKGSTESLENTILQKGQAIYAIDYQVNKIIYQRGIKTLLGYHKSEFTTQLLHNDLLHPKQKIQVGLIINAVISRALEGGLPKDAKFILLYKLKHKNGDFKTILRQTSVFKKSAKGIMTAVYSQITDVSSIIDTSRVEWKLEGADELFENDLKSLIAERCREFFTPKEHDIIKMLSRGLSSEEISIINGTSKHTVDTQRRHLLRKTNTRNARELLHFVDAISK